MTTAMEHIDYAYDTENLRAELVNLHVQYQVKRETSAYTDGYADASNYGRDGYMIVTEWSDSLRSQYDRGFKRGLRVFKSRS